MDSEWTVSLSLICEVCHIWLKMYKNRSRGLKRTASVLTSATASTSSLSEERATEERTNSSREPLRERDETNVASSNARRNSDQRENVSPPPPKKPNNQNTGGDRKSDKETLPKSQSNPKPCPKPASRVARDRSNKTSLLSNHVDVDVNTLCMAFSTKFEELVTKSGFKLHDGEEPFLLSEYNVTSYFCCAA